MIYKHIANKYRSSQRHFFYFDAESSTEIPADDSAEDLCEGLF